MVKRNCFFWTYCNSYNSFKFKNYLSKVNHTWNHPLVFMHLCKLFGLIKLNTICFFSPSWRNDYGVGHSSDTKGLCLTKLSSEMLQNLPFLGIKHYPKSFFLLSFSVNLLDLSQTQNCWKWVFLFQKYFRFWINFVKDYFIKYKHDISEECRVINFEDTLKWFLGNVSLTQNQNFFLPTYEKIYVEDKMLLIVIVLSGQLVPKLQITISWYKLEMKVSGLSKLSKLFKTKNKLSFGWSIGEIFDIVRMCLA